MRRFLLALVFIGVATALAQDVLLRPGDQIELRLGGVPTEEVTQVSGSYQVDGEGYLNLPHIGRVKAAGLGQAEVQRAIEQKYLSEKIYTNPSITLSVPTQARFVNVDGAVKAPQRVPFTPDLTVLGAISAAGGFNEFADQTKVRLLSGGTVTMINIKEVRRDPNRDLKVKPGDSIQVPQGFL